MYENGKQISGIDWCAIFKRRPDLEPPGYHEIVNELYPKEEPTDD
mgnify:CR=1 FL=1